MPRFNPADCVTALVTPFRGAKPNLAGLRRNVRFQLDAGIKYLLACGSTGESPSLTEDEYEAAVTTVVAAADGRAAVMAGAGTNNTVRSAKQARLAERLGADSLLVVAPYYNKPTQEGLYRHFRAVAESVRLPVVVYNIPPRSVINIAPATIERLARDCANIVAVKEASGQLDQVTEILARCGERITVLSGDDSLTLPMLAVGAQGVVSVVSNVVPGDVLAMVGHFKAGRTREAAQSHRRLFPLIKAMFIESNPAPVKYAMSLLGMAAGEPRLPLVPPTDENQQAIRRALLAYGLGSRRARG
jgi:4-hydroxy-tetrahydrodipicolinate synthase